MSTSVLSKLEEKYYRNFKVLKIAFGEQIMGRTQLPE
jgi:hypothetical protein